MGGSPHRGANLSVERVMSNKLCVDCHSVGEPRKKVKGYFLMEVALWGVGFMTLLVGIGVPILFVAFLYSLWRFFSEASYACRACGSAVIIPLNSERARQILTQVDDLDLGRPVGGRQ